MPDPTVFYKALGVAIETYIVVEGEVNAAGGDTTSIKRPKGQADRPIERAGQKTQGHTHPGQNGLAIPLCRVVRNWKGGNSVLLGGCRCRDGGTEQNIGWKGGGEEAARQRRMSLVYRGNNWWLCVCVWEERGGVS